MNMGGSMPRPSQCDLGQASYHMIRILVRLDLNRVSIKWMYIINIREW